MFSPIVLNEMASWLLRIKDVNVKINFPSVRAQVESPKQFSKAAHSAALGPSLPAQSAVFPQIVLSVVGIAAAWGG